MYKIDPKMASVSESSLWIPIDHNVVTPYHKACNRIPGTFPPTLFVRGTVRVKLSKNGFHGPTVFNFVVRNFVYR
jgi:hypothetical protein